MKTVWTKMLLGLLALVVVVGSATPASAQYHRRYHHRPYHRHYYHHHR